MRSVALAYLIKTIYKHEAIAIGYKTLDLLTRQMLYDWADKIVAVDRNVYNKLLTDYGVGFFDRVFLIDVGEDIWHNPFAQELQHKLMKHLKDLKL